MWGPIIASVHFILGIDNFRVDKGNAMLSEPSLMWFARFEPTSIIIIAYEIR